MSIKKAAMINAVGKYSTILVQMIVNIILARLLSPSEYGVVAIITTFSTFFYTLSAMGLGTAIIQNKDLETEDVDSIFSFSVYMSFGIAFFFGILSFGIAKLYDNSVYIGLGWLLSVSIFFRGMNMVPDGILSRDKRFVLMAVRSAIVYISAGVVAILLAYFKFSFYALVVQNIFSALITFIWNYSSTRPKFTIRIKLDSIKKIFSYASFQMGAQIVGYFSDNLDQLIVGKVLGEKQVGYYNKAYTLSNYPINNISSIITSILHSLLSDYQKDNNKLFDYHIKINRLMCVIGVFISAVCFLSAKEIIFILFGKKWIVSVICFRALSVTIFIRMMSSALNAIFQSLGRTDLFFYLKACNLIVLIIAIIVGLFLLGGLSGFSKMISVAYILNYLLAIYILCKYGFRIGVKSHVIHMYREIIVMIVMFCSAIIYPFSIDGLWLSLLCKTLFLFVIFILLCFIFEKNYFMEIIRKK